MITKEKTKEELILELETLQRKFDSLKKLSGLSRSDARHRERDLEIFGRRVNNNTSRLKLVADTINMAWWDLDIVKGNIKFYKRISNILGYPVDTFHQYKDFTDLIVPDDYEIARKAMQDHIDGYSQVYNSHYRILSSSGEYRWLHDTGIIVKRDQNGLPLKISGFVNDITSLKLTELEYDNQTLQLKNTEAKYQRLIESINEAVYEIDDKGVVVYISPVIERVAGYTPEEIIGKTIVSFIGEDDYPLEERIRKLHQGNDESGDFRFFNKNNEECWVSFSTKPIFTNGVVTGGSGVLIDITEKKKAEIALQESEEKYRLLAENISDVIWVYNLNQNKFTYLSPSVYQLRGFTANEAVDRELEHGLSPESVDQIRKKIPVTFKEFIADPSRKKLYMDEIQIVAKNGSMIWIETNAHYNLAKNGEIEIHGVSRDINKRKQSEIQLTKYSEELKISEEKFFNIFNNSPVSMLISNLQTNIIIDVNEQFLNTLGFSKNELIGRGFNELNISLNDDKWSEIRKKQMAGVSVRDYEVTIESKSGLDIDFLLSVDQIKIKEFEYMLITAVDITEIKNHEKKIKYLHDQQKLIADISQLLNRPDDFTPILDEVLRLIGLHTGTSRTYIFEDSENGAAASVTYEWCNVGIVPQKANLQNFPYELIPSWKKLLDRDGCIFSENIREFPPDIQAVLERFGVKSILVYPLFIGSKYHGFIGFDESSKAKTWTRYEIDLLRTVASIISNAFERKLVGEKLLNNELRLKLAIESAKEGIWDWDIVTGHFYFSEVWCRMMGYGPEEAEPEISSWENRIFPDDRPIVMEALYKHLSGEAEYYEATYRVRTMDGQMKWFLDHGMVVERNSGNQPLRAIGMNIDISKQKENEIKLQESIGTQQKLFSIIAHDLRGPLGSFMQVLDLLTNGRVTDERLRNKFLDELKKSSRMTFSLLENLLNWSRSQANTINLEPENYSISKLIQDNVDLMEPIANHKSINLMVKTDNQLTVFCDRDTINLVIRNLLSNAIKFTKNNGSVRVSVKAAGEMVEVEVADKGVGMEKYALDRLFRLGSLPSAYGTNKEQGSGIGLVLCKDFVERNKGQIYAESVLGEGSRFVFLLPTGK